MSFLEKIRPIKIKHAKELRSRYTVYKPERPASMPIRDFEVALTGEDRIIAEIKHRSPSHPAFVQPARPATLARIYQRNGAAALSIVVDADHFGTSLADVAEVRAATNLPILTKDFIVDEAQITEAWAAGADAVLLIVRMLEVARLKELLIFAHDLGLHVLVECHDRDDIEQALGAGARLVGVNNRNLATLTTDLSHGAGMLPHLPAGVVRISESGLYTRADILTMAGHGADAFLIGHALLQAADPGRKVAELGGREPEQGLRVKVCGLTSVEDARLAHEAGADILGLILADSPRRVGRDDGRAIRAALPETRLCGVFVNPSVGEVEEAATALGLDLVQLHGQESPELVREVRDRTGLPVIKALTPDQADPDTARHYQAAAYILVDLPKGPEKGRFDPADCRRAASNITAAGMDVLLAGGLNPDNITETIKETRPFGVDVASGVENAPGRKDPLKTRNFITEARR